MLEKELVSEMRNVQRLVAVGFTVLSAVTGASGCFFNDANDCSFDITLPCHDAGTGGTGGSSPDCVPGADNANIDETCGVFVSRSLGKPGADGSKGAPFATIGSALTQAPGKAIYVCGEILTEAVAIDSGDVTLYGALDCANGWAYDPSKKSAVAPAADEVPFTVGKGAGATVFDFRFDAADAVKNGGSSIAVIADQGAELMLERCDLLARNGKQGAAGAQPAGSGTPGPAGQDGEAGCLDLANKTGGDPGLNTCDLISRNGGQGGTGTKSDGSVGGDGKPDGTGGKGGKGQDSSQCDPGTIGLEGVPGDPGDGANGIGTISASGYEGAEGADGKPNSTPGQGGGGGGGAKVCQNMGFAGPGGGGGGAGGCGGLPGKGGKGGGSSIGLLSDAATVSLTVVSITTSKGGVGGMGGDGQLGGLGGDGGGAGSNNSDLDAKACGGGPGGKGGKGGPGGGGLGGHSVAIAYKGTPPAQAKMQFTIGTPGIGGGAGNGSMVPAAHGAEGFKCKALSFNDGAPSCTN